MTVVDVPSASPNEEGQGHCGTSLGCLGMWILTPSLAFSLKELVVNMPCIAFAPSRDQIVPLHSEGMHRRVCIDTALALPGKNLSHCTGRVYLVFSFPPIDPHIMRWGPDWEIGFALLLYKNKKGEL